MTPAQLINHILKTRGYTSYLEIGTHEGATYNAIDIENKICVDPEKYFDGLTHHMTSDEFFANNTEKYDLIFVDGFHMEEQVTKDILNSLESLNEEGCIVCHDCLPPCEEWTTKYYCGTVYKSLMDLKMSRDDISMTLINQDVGFCLIEKGSQTLLERKDIHKDYNWYMQNHKTVFNYLDTEDDVYGHLYDKIHVNLFDSNFIHTLDQYGYITSTYATKPKKIVWENKLKVYDGITIFTDNHITDPVVDEVECPTKIAWLFEPRSIEPSMYENILKVHDKFDFILTFDEELKLAFPDKVIPYVIGQSRVSDKDAKFYPKKRLVSMIASNKQMTEGHRFRHEIVEALHKKYEFDLFGTGYNPFKHKKDALGDYCFSISVLNCSRKDFFTEVLVDNFRTGTVPILWGLPNLPDYFDPEGVIGFETLEDLDRILSNLTVDDYIKRKEAIKHNFKLAKKYLCTDDMIADILKEKFGL